MRYTVYKHTSPSGKVYIGITRQRPERRYGGGRGYAHSPHMNAAIKKYGWENFEHEIIAENLSQEAAERLEVELIAEYHAADRAYGYNADKGGSTGPKHSEATRAKIGEANKKRVWSEEAKQKMRAYKLAHPTSPETARKIGDANRGRKHRPESVEKIRQAQPKKPVKNLTTGRSYPSVMEAARANKLDPSCIVACCRGRQKTHGGCEWSYEEVIV